MRWRGALVLALLCCALTAGAVSGEPTPTRVHFTAAGDYDDNTTTNGVLTALATTGSDAHFTLGDMSYGTTGAEEQWCDYVKARVGQQFPFQLLAGNHESNGINGNINDFSACLPNQLPGVVGTYGRQYYVDVPKTNPLVRFVMISPDLTFTGNNHWTYPAGSARYNWVSNTIDAARSAQIPWVVVGMHKPCLSLGTYGCDSGSDLANLMLQKKVDLVLSGHEHIYQRTKQLSLGSGCTSLTVGSYNPACVSDSDDTVTKGVGTVFATIGTGGTPLRDVNQSDPEAGYFKASSGANLNPTYGFGDFDVTPDTLTASFVRGFGANFTDSFTIDKNGTPPANQDPNAVFTSSTNGLTATFNSAGTGDPDGNIASYAWSFGDGATSTAPNPSRTYAAAGTYPVSLTVTDNDGATDTATGSVTVSATPPPTNLASDEFERSVTNGWGTADVGGAWTIRNSPSRLRVADGAGQMTMTAGATSYADLNSVSSNSVRLDTEFSVDKLGEGTWVGMTGRKNAANESYVARLTLTAAGRGTLLLTGPSGTLTSVVSPITFAPNTRYRFAMEATGTSPTTLSTKIWPANQTEPAAWQRTATNSFAALQAAGSPGLFTYLSSSAGAAAPVRISFHRFTVTRAN